MRIFFLLSLVFLQSCIRETKPDYIQHLDATTVNFNQTMIKEHQLYCNGYGGRLMKDVSGVYLRYFTNQNLDLGASRRLVIDCVEKLTADINANEKLGPFLNPNPFPPEKIEMSIGVIDPDSEFFREGSVAHIHATQGKIFYSAYSFTKNKLESLGEEDYAEALRIVRSEAASMKEMQESPQA